MPITLGVIHGNICLTRQLTKLVRVDAFGNRHPNTDTDRFLDTDPIKMIARDILLAALSHLTTLVCIGIDQHGSELVSTETIQLVTLTQRTLQNTTQCRDQTIAGLVPVGIIDCLEPVRDRRQHWTASVTRRL